MEWDSLRVVLAIHRRGSMTAAADALGVDRATVLRRLDGLEAQLKTRLFDRRPDGCALTPSGQNIIGLVQGVEQAMTALQHRVEGDDRRAEGSVKLAGPAFLLDHVIGPSIPLLKDLYPRLTLDLWTDHDQLDLSRGEADLAIRFQRPVSDQVAARKIGSVALALYASDSYLARRGMPYGDLDGHDLLLLEGAFAAHPAMGWLWDQIGRTTVAVRSNAIAPLVGAMRAGAGIACLPALVVPDLAGVSVLAPGVVGRFDIHLATHRDLRDRARVKAVHDYVIRLFAQRSALLNGAAIDRLFATPSADASDR